MTPHRKQYIMALLEFTALLPMEKDGKPYSNNWRRAVVEFVYESMKK